MKIDNIYMVMEDQVIPRHWVLTVKRCECGQMLYWDTKKHEWHCLKPSCKLYKSHLEKRVIPQVKVDRVLELGEVLTIKEIAGRVKLSEKDVCRILRENNIL